VDGKKHPTDVIGCRQDRPVPSAIGQGAPLLMTGLRGSSLKTAGKSLEKGWKKEAAG